MQMLTTSPAFNPFHLYINYKMYEIGGFVFYKSYGALIKTPRGWFGCNNQIREGLKIPNVLLRRKEKFDGETFAIIGKKYDKPCAFLYIPFEFFDFEQTEQVEDRGWYELHYHVYTSRKNPKVIVEDLSNQWEVVKKPEKVKATKTFDLLVAARMEVVRLEKECEKLDPYNKMRYQYEKRGLLKG